MHTIYIVYGIWYVIYVYVLKLGPAFQKTVRVDTEGS